MKRTDFITRVQCLVIGCSLTLAGCYYDKEAILYPDLANCTPITSPSFSKDIMPLLNTKCNTCHSGSAPSGGISLDTYTEVVKYADNGKLMGSIRQTTGYSPMPKNSGKMSTCEIDNIQNWINSGKLDN